MKMAEVIQLEKKLPQNKPPGGLVGTNKGLRRIWLVGFYY